MSAIGGSPVLRGINEEDRDFTVSLSGSPTSDDVGKPVTADLSANDTYKLAGDGDVIEGVLLSVEDRTIEGIKTGAVEFGGCHEFAVKNGSTVVVGDTVQGGTGATVKPLTFAASFVATTTTLGGLTTPQIASLGRNKVTAVRTVSAVDYATVKFR